jgi:hypothetical protein
MSDIQYVGQPLNDEILKFTPYDIELEEGSVFVIRAFFNELPAGNHYLLKSDDVTFLFNS